MKELNHNIFTLLNPAGNSTEEHMGFDGSKLKSKNGRINKVNLSQSLLYFIISVISISPSFAQSTHTVKIASSEWPPYLSRDHEEGGIALHLIKEAFSLEGINVEYGWLPPKRSYLEALAGIAWDGTAVWTKTDEREKDFYYSDPIFTTKDVFFHLKNYPLKWETLEDLNGLLIGATIGYYYGEAFKKAEEDGTILVDRIASDENNFKKLLFGRIQAFPQALDVGYCLLEKNFSKHQISQITHHPKVIKEFVFYLLLTKKNPENKEKINKFNRGLKKLIQNGDYDKLFENHRKKLKQFQKHDS